MAGGAVSIAVGAVALARGQSTVLGISEILLGILGGYIGKALWDVGDFTKITREANHVDKLMLERANINQELGNYRQ